MRRSIMFEKRRKARELKRKGWSNLKIAHYLVVDKDSIRNWLEMDEGEIEKDRRGWPRGKFKKYSEFEKRRIIEIRERLEVEASAFGSKLIKREYLKKYGKEVSEWFINKTVREYKEMKNSDPKKEAAPQHTEYPLRKLRRWGRVIMSLDLMGLLKMKENGAPVYFLSCRYLYPCTLGIVSQIASQTCDEVIRTLKYIWQTFLKPDLIKFNYNSTFGGNLSRERHLGRLAIFLLNLGITPLYTSLPETNGNIDLEEFGNTFSETFYRNLCRPFQQKNDLKIERFYLEYGSRTDPHGDELRNPFPSFRNAFKGTNLENRHVNRFQENRIFFLHIVKPNGQVGNPHQSGLIKILATEVNLNCELINSVVFSRLDICKKKLFIYHERENGRNVLIKKMDFWIENLKYT